MPLKVLQQDWGEYNDLKTLLGFDARQFSVTQSWEIEYLINQVLTIYPEYKRDAISYAIENCCLFALYDPPRHLVVECVMRRLRLSNLP